MPCCITRSNRERYAANLRRELPRIPFAPDLHAFTTAGRKLADLHVGYEQAKEYPLKRRENPKAPLNWRVEKMILIKVGTRSTASPSEKKVRDGVESIPTASIIYNEFLTLEGIPPETFEYRLGNRSALEWVIDQYQMSTDKRSGITNDPQPPQ